MTGRTLPHWLGITLLICIAITMASNHIAARFAFNHGVTVVTAVAFRAGVTSLVVFALLLITRTPLHLAALTLRRAALIGALFVVQSYCLYSAVARIQVALALLAFNTFPLMLAMLVWAFEGKRPSRRLLFAMPIALFGLSLALNVWGANHLGQQWALLGGGLLLAMTGAIAFSFALMLTSRWLGDVDGRVRSCLTMSTVAVLALVGGALSGTLALPADHAGWLGLSGLCILYGFGITTLFIVLPRMGAAKYAALLNFEPIAAMFLGWAILGQDVTPIQIVGGIVVIGAIVSISLNHPAPLPDSN